MEVDETMPQNYTDIVKIEIKTECDEERDTYGKMPSTSGKLQQDSDLIVIKTPAVVLTRLPEHVISALRPLTPQQFYSEDDSHSSCSGSDMQWEPEPEPEPELEPEDRSSGSEFSISPIKKNGKDTTAAPSLSRKPNKNSNNPVSDPAPVIISSAFAHCASETTKLRPDFPEEEVKMGALVLARKRAMRWQRGTVVEMIMKENGRLKYKVNFEEKGKTLVSAHHIAFDTTPKLEQLYVGARVVVQCPDNKSRFRPGVLIELPSRKNRLRFLIFLDDHRPLYVGLPLFHLVCKQLENAVDDIPESTHKSFIAQYLKTWPYPHLTQYKVGQSLNVELDGALQRCEVQLMDCSLMQVLFQHNQHEEWIYRGSMRLEHMAKFLELKEGGKDSSSDDSD